MAPVPGASGFVEDPVIDDGGRRVRREIVPADAAAHFVACPLRKAICCQSCADLKFDVSRFIARGSRLRCFHGRPGRGCPGRPCWQNTTAATRLQLLQRKNPRRARLPVRSSVSIGSSGSSCNSTSSTSTVVAAGFWFGNNETYTSVGCSGSAAARIGARHEEQEYCQCSAKAERGEAQTADVPSQSVHVPGLISPL